MAATSKEDGKMRKMEGDEDMRTLECLRGRLLAERQASRVAKEDAEFMAKKLLELQNRLKEEIRLKNKAENKLEFLKRKLESLKPSSVAVETEQSSLSSSEYSATSRRQSTSASSSNNPEDNEPKPTVKDLEISKASSQNEVANSITSEKSHESDAFTEENSTVFCSSPASSSTSSLDFPSPEYPSHKSEDSKSGDHISYSKPKSLMEKIQNGKLEYVDNKLALVPVSMPATSHTSTTDLKPVSASVREALDVLRNIRENLQLKLKYANNNRQ